MIPPNFRLATGVSKFTGESKPDSWLEDYRVAVQIGGGNDEVAMKHLPLMLEGSARAWLNQLAPGSIYSWEELARVFVRTFEGTCKRPAGLTGPECFSIAIRATVIPPNFRLATGVSKFTGESKPDSWLEDYRVAVQIGGGNDEVAMKHLPLMLEGSARAWLNQLAPGSIYSWEELARVFVRTFEGTCKRPAGLIELQSCVQKPKKQSSPGGP